MAVVGGPVLGPIVGGAIVQSYLRWRWTEYVSYLSINSWHPIRLLTTLGHRNHDDVHPTT